MPFAFGAFVALLPTYLIRFHIGLLPTTLLEIIFWAFFGCWLFIDGRRRKAWSALGRWAEPMLLLFIGGTVGVLISPDTLAALGLWRAYILEPMLLFVMCADLVKKERSVEMVRRGFAFLLIVIGLTAVYQKITGFGIPNPVWQAGEHRRVTSFFGFPNAIGLLVAPLLPLMAGWAAALIREKKRPAALPILAFGLGIAAIAFAVSEGAMIGVAAGLMIFCVAYRPLRILAVCSIIAACLIVSLYRPATDYVSGILGMTDDSTSVRAVVWRESWAMLKDHPVFGAGLAGYPAIMSAYHSVQHIEIFQYPHDIFLNFWSETGLIGLIGFLGIVILFFVRIVPVARRRPDDPWIAAVAAAMVALLVHGLVDVPYFKNDLAMLFWLIVALADTQQLYERRKG